jgi:dTDP-glucose 4,6-dehydratase
LAVALISGDVCDFEFPSEKFTHILHFAVEYTSPERMLNGIVRGTQRLLDFAKTSSAKEFLFASSGAVYGALPSDLAFVPESYLGAPDTNDPRSAYGEGKRVAELVLSIASSEWGLNAKIARCFAQVGPYMPLDGSFAAGNFIRDALSGGPIKIQGDGTPIRSYIYGSDLATWLWTILFNGRSCQPYNVGGSEPISISELAQMVCESFGGDIKINIQRQVEGTSVRNQYVPDISRAQTELKISPLTSLDEAVKRAVKWYLSK